VVVGLEALLDFGFWLSIPACLPQLAGLAQRKGTIFNSLFTLSGSLLTLLLFKHCDNTGNLVAL